MLKLVLYLTITNFLLDSYLILSGVCTTDSKPALSANLALTRQKTHKQMLNTTHPIKILLHSYLIMSGVFC